MQPSVLEVDNRVFEEDLPVTEAWPAEAVKQLGGDKALEAEDLPWVC